MTAQPANGPLAADRVSEVALGPWETIGVVRGTDRLLTITRTSVDPGLPAAARSESGQTVSVGCDLLVAGPELPSFLFVAQPSDDEIRISGGLAAAVCDGRGSTESVASRLSDAAIECLLGAQHLIAGLLASISGTIVTAAPNGISFDGTQPRLTWTIAPPRGPSATFDVTDPGNYVDAGGTARRSAVLMSGGVDSTFVAHRLSSHGVDTIGLTAQFEDGAAVNGSDYARDVARALGIEHRSVRVPTPSGEALFDLARISPNPPLDRATWAQTHLGFAAVGHGCDEIVTGEGGDEIFGPPRTLRAHPHSAESAAKALDRIWVEPATDASLDYRRPPHLATAVVRSRRPVWASRLDSHGAAVLREGWVFSSLAAKRQATAAMTSCRVRDPLLGTVRELTRRPRAWDDGGYGKAPLTGALPGTLAATLAQQAKRHFRVPIRHWLQRLSDDVARDPGLHAIGEELDHRLGRAGVPLSRAAANVGDEVARGTAHDLGMRYAWNRLQLSLWIAALEGRYPCRVPVTGAA